jgi:hypothetical protein
MATRMDREGRIEDILKFLHRNWLMNQRRMSLGEYARFAGISKSPHLRNVFEDMLDRGVIDIKGDNYRNTVIYTFKPNYDYISKYYPKLNQVLTTIGGQEQLL